MYIIIYSHKHDMCRFCPLINLFNKRFYQFDSEESARIAADTYADQQNVICYVINMKEYIRE